MIANRRDKWFTRIRPKSSDFESSETPLEPLETPRNQPEAPEFEARQL